MKRTFTFLVSLFAVTFAMAQAPEGVFAKASVAPVMDGLVDAEWAKATKYNIDRAVGTETPTIGASGESTWQGLWTMDGVYVLLKIADNAFYPHYAVTPAGENWHYDKPEIYFDVNSDLLADGGAPGSAAETKPGHYQFAPAFTNLKNDGTPLTENGVVHAFKVDGSNYVCEYFIPMTTLRDKSNVIVDKTATIGFDVVFIDRDPTDLVRNQAVWSNTGANYDNMNDAGRVTFADAESDVFIDEIVLTGGSITTNKGTLQIVADISPADATYKTLIWTVENGTGKASIDANGVVTALTDGTVTVTGKSSDVQGMDASVEVVISGQSVSRDDIWNNFNLIKNWDFNTEDASTVSGLASWGGWLDGAGQIKAVLNEGVVEMTTELFEGQIYHYQFSQSGLQAMPDVPYVVTFKSWADAERLNAIDFEDTEANGYNRFGASSDPEAQGGRSEWHYTLTTEPQWFTFHVTFDEIIASTNQKMQWLQSQASGTVYLDSVLLVTQDEYDLLQTLPPTGTKSFVNSIDRVYPNPVGNAKTLTIEISKANSKVAIYNAIGQKMTEKVSTGNVAKFDVSSLQRGMYFIRLEDGTTQKFIK